MSASQPPPEELIALPGPARPCQALPGLGWRWQLGVTAALQIALLLAPGCSKRGLLAACVLLERPPLVPAQLSRAATLTCCPPCCTASPGLPALPQRRYSVAKIETSQTYEKGRPKLGGLSDPRLGTMDRALKCTTDGNGVLDCPGYFGHIELAKPMFHVHFLKTVVKVLRCVSYHNSKLMILPVRSAAAAHAGRGPAGWWGRGRGAGGVRQRCGGCRGSRPLGSRAQESSLWLCLQT